MAELVKLQNRLPTVKLSVGFESSASPGRPVPVVWIEIQRGSSMIARIRASQDDLGVPADFDPATYRYSEPPFAFSQNLGDQIGAATSMALGEEAVLWLQLADPVGFLSVLPLERMLRPFVGGGRPIMRIPNFALSPAIPADSIDIAVCLSEPAASILFDGLEFLRGFIPALLDTYPARMHIFTDADTYGEMITDHSLGRFTGAAARLVLHDPAGAPPAARTATESRSDSGTAVTNPWLLWMLQELADVTVDVVHFVTHGYTRGGQSALALAESPVANEDRMWARFVGPNQAAAWLVHLGAWAVGFTSPVRNFSSMGLREFFDDLARLRAGPILHHEAGLDPLSTEAARAYAGLLLGQQPELLPAVSLYAHPLVFSGNRYPGETGVDSFADVMVSSSLGPQPPASSAPAWVTSTRRYLEQSVATMFPEPEEPTSTAQVAAGEGAERALRFVSEVLGRLGDSS
jgi:hypothetical protein